MTGLDEDALRCAAFELFIASCCPSPELRECMRIQLQVSVAQAEIATAALEHGGARLAPNLSVPCALLSADLSARPWTPRLIGAAGGAAAASTEQGKFERRQALLLLEGLAGAPQSQAREAAVKALRGVAKGARPGVSGRQRLPGSSGRHQAPPPLPPRRASAAGGASPLGASPPAGAAGAAGGGAAAANGGIEARRYTTGTVPQHVTPPPLPPLPPGAAAATPSPSPNQHSPNSGGRYSPSAAAAAAAAALGSRNLSRWALPSSLAAPLLSLLFNAAYDCVDERSAEEAPEAQQIWRALEGVAPPALCHAHAALAALRRAAAAALSVDFTAAPRVPVNRAGSGVAGVLSAAAIAAAEDPATRALERAQGELFESGRACRGDFSPTSGALGDSDSDRGRACRAHAHAVLCSAGAIASAVAVHTAAAAANPQNFPHAEMLGEWFSVALMAEAAAAETGVGDSDGGEDGEGGGESGGDGRGRGSDVGGPVAAAAAPGPGPQESAAARTIGEDVGNTVYAACCSRAVVATSRRSQDRGGGFSSPMPTGGSVVSGGGAGALEGFGSPAASTPGGGGAELARCEAAAAHVPDAAEAVASVFAKALFGSRPAAAAVYYALCVLHSKLEADVNSAAQHASFIEGRVARLLIAAGSASERLCALAAAAADKARPPVNLRVSAAALALAPAHPPLHPLDIQWLAAPLLDEWVGDRVHRLSEMCARALQLENWKSSPKKPARSAVETLTAANEAIDAFLGLGVPPQKDQMRRLLLGLAALLQQFAVTVVTGLGPPRALAGPPPVLTRYKREAVALLMEKEKSSPEMPGRAAQKRGARREQGASFPCAGAPFWPCACRCRHLR